MNQPHSPAHSDALCPPPKVSVVMIAFNVERFIAQALDSVLMQEVDFDYEVVVGDDASTDRTREILVDYASQHPDRIRLILRPENVGMNPNFIATFFEARGDYVALLDGDDYWLSPKKLQKQVEFLDGHPECTVCFHNALVVYEDGEQEPHPFHMARPNRRLAARIPKARSSVQDLVTGNFLQTGSVMYRGNTLMTVPGWYLTMPTFDWPLHVLHAERGEIAYLDEVLSAYRVRTEGFWSSGMSYFRTADELEFMARAYHTLNRHLEYRFDAQVRRSLASLCTRRASMCLEDGQYRAARRYAVQALRMAGPRPHRKQLRAVKVIVRSVMQQLGRRPTMGAGA
jgi:glycosyltransferase involved in cell wall biosynthesis